MWYQRMKVDCTSLQLKCVVMYGLLNMCYKLMCVNFTI